MKKNILLTGATGLLGVELKKILLKNRNVKVFLLSRSPRKFGRQSNGELKVRYLHGDMTLPNLGIRSSEYKHLIKSIDEIYHCAALTDFRESLNKIRLINVEGTKNIIDFALKASRMSKFHYISSAFIAGNYQGAFEEDDFDLGQTFNNTYEQSKYEAELLLKKLMGKVSFNILIYRPSIIVGRYQTGATNQMGLLIRLFRLLKSEIFKELPINFDAELNIIPSDVAAKAIHKLGNASFDSRTYHIITPKSFKLKHIIEIVASKLKCKQPTLVAYSRFRSSRLTAVQRSILEPFLPYFNFKVIFKSKLTNRRLRELGFIYPKVNDAFIFRILRFAVKAGYLNESNSKIRSKICILN